MGREVVLPSGTAGGQVLGRHTGVIEGALGDKGFRLFRRLRSKYSLSLVAVFIHNVYIPHTHTERAVAATGRLKLTKSRARAASRTPPLSLETHGS